MLVFVLNFYFFFESVAFTRITACAEQEFSFRIIATSSKYLNTSFVNILRVMLFIFLQNRSWSVKNKPTKKRIDAEIQVTLKQAPARNRREEKMSYRLSYQITKPNCKLTLLGFECVFHKVYYLDYLLLLLL